MKTARITALQKTLQQDLADKNGAEGISSGCLWLEWQVFYTEYTKPDFTSVR